MTPERTAVGAVIAVPLLVLLLAFAVLVVVVNGIAHPFGSGTGTSVVPGVSARAAADIPPQFLALYHRDGTLCPGLDWAVLAGIGKTETDHGRSTLPGVASGENFAGAAGPMQFLAPTFAAVVARHRPPPGGAVPPSRYEPSDAVHTAAAYLCDSGLDAPPASPQHPAELHRAVFTYNHSEDYVRTVLARAASYRTSIAPPSMPLAPGPAPTPVGTGSRGPPTFRMRFAAPSERPRRSSRMHLRAWRRAAPSVLTSPPTLPRTSLQR